MVRDRLWVRLYCAALAGVVARGRLDSDNAAGEARRYADAARKALVDFDEQGAHAESRAQAVEAAFPAGAWDGGATVTR